MSVTTLKTAVVILISVSAVQFAKSKFTGYIVGGETASIEQFPYSVFVSKLCSNISSTCGASIINQAILLTAAHCVSKCVPKGAFQNMKAYSGSEVKYKGFQSNVIAFKIHEQYNYTTNGNDIALLKLEKELTFGKKVKRVALVKNLPKSKYTSAVVAGWGWTDSVGTRGDFLKYATQELIYQDTCSNLLEGIPLGTICGKDLTSYPEKGDSGSALIVDDYIQIGLVSFKKRDYSNSTIVYTDVRYFYDWIIKSAADLCCNKTSTYLSVLSNEYMLKCQMGQALV